MEYRIGDVLWVQGTHGYTYAQITQVYDKFIEVTRNDIDYDHFVWKHEIEAIYNNVSALMSNQAVHRWRAKHYNRIQAHDLWNVLETAAPSGGKFYRAFFYDGDWNVTSGYQNKYGRIMWSDCKRLKINRKAIQ